MSKFKFGRFGSVVVTLLLVYAFVKLVIPAISRSITGMNEFPLTVPGTLVLFYMVLTLVALYMFITFSDDIMCEKNGKKR